MVLLANQVCRCAISMVAGSRQRQLIYSSSVAKTNIWLCQPSPSGIDCALLRLIGCHVVHRAKKQLKFGY